MNDANAHVLPIGNLDESDAERCVVEAVNGPGSFGLAPLVELVVGGVRMVGPGAVVGVEGAGGGGIPESAVGLRRGAWGFFLVWFGGSDTLDLEEEEDLTLFGEGSMAQLSLLIMDLDLPLMFFECLGSSGSGDEEGVSAV